MITTIISDLSKVQNKIFRTEYALGLILSYTSTGKANIVFTINKLKVNHNELCDICQWYLYQRRIIGTSHHSLNEKAMFTFGAV